MRILPKKASMRLKRVGDWIQYLTETGRTFYYNEKNGEFQWVEPDKGGSGSAGSAASGAGGKPGTADEGVGDGTATGGGGGSSMPDLGDWKPYKDPETGAVFWYNQKTNVSQWECPFDSPNLNSGNDRDLDGDEEAVQVITDDDLGI